MFYFPTVPAGGYTVSRKKAVANDQLLEQAESSDLRAEAMPLHRAITADDEAGMVEAILYVQNSTCGTNGITPAT
jgi:hypothetical protein